MTKPDIFDEIINYLENCSQSDSGRTVISHEIYEKLFAETRKFKQPSATPTVNRQQQKSISNVKPQQFTAAPLPDLNNCNLEELSRLTAECTRCTLCEQRNNVVFGDGDPNADLMFIGEGPGYHEDMQGIPFVGDAGNLLTKMIVAMQYTRAQVYLANIVKCRPPNNRNPNDNEAVCCIPYLNRQIELINPKAIVLLGAVPLKYILNRTGINKNRGQWFEYRNIPTLATFHPSYLLRYQNAKRDAWHDLQMVMKLLNN